MSAYYPEGLSGADICYMEGCEYRGGGACVRCGRRLRCLCGQFVRADAIDAHADACRWISRNIEHAA